MGIPPSPQFIAGLSEVWEAQDLQLAPDVLGPSPEPVGSMLTLGNVRIELN